MNITFDYDKEDNVYFGQETTSIYSTHLTISRKDQYVNIDMSVPEAYDFIRRFQEELDEYKNKHYYWKHTDKNGTYVEPDSEGDTYGK